MSPKRWLPDQDGVDDTVPQERHIAFSRQLGELDDVSPYNSAGRKNRLKHIELFDVSNLDENGEIATPDQARYVFNKANALFHCDSSFNGRRAGLVSAIPTQFTSSTSDHACQSLLLAHELPQNESGDIGNTEFADSRTAYADLPQETKDRIDSYIVDHSQLHSRRKGAPNNALVWEDKVGSL